MKVINITILIILFYTVYLFFLFYKYFNINYPNDNIVINENEIYSTYRNIYRESIYSQSPNMTSIIILLKSALQHKDGNVYINIDIIRLFSIAYRRTIKNKICGDISESPNQIFTYYKYVKSLNLKNATICEIGFLFGVSSLTLFFAAGLSSRYFGFDYGLPQSKNIYSLLEQYFQMKMIWGKSQDTVPLFNESIKCDIIHIDGSHVPQMIYEDIKNMRRFSNIKSLLIVDDINSNNFAWKESIKYRFVREIECSSYKSFCIGLYI